MHREGWSPERGPLMFDSPGVEELLAAVARYLRDEAGPALGAGSAPADHAALAYQARVAANMLDMVRRQGLLAPAADAAERARLQALLGETCEVGEVGEVGGPGAAADLARLNQHLADRIADGTLDLAAPGLADHLWRTTLDKLAVDQPGYASYLRCIADAATGPSA